MLLRAFGIHGSRQGVVVPAKNVEGAVGEEDVGASDTLGGDNGDEGDEGKSGKGSGSDPRT